VWHDNNEQHQAKFQEEEEEDIICICPQMFFYEILKWMNDLDCPLSHGTSFNKGFVCHIVALPFYILKISILRQKKNYYGKLKYFTLQNYNLQKNSSEKKPKYFKIS